MGRNFSLDDLPPAMRAQAIEQLRNRPTAGPVIPEDLAEKPWQEIVVKTFKDRGWLVYHTFDSRHSPKGFPDIVAVHPGLNRLAGLEGAATTTSEPGFQALLRTLTEQTGRVIVAELKRDSGRLRPEQRMWLYAFRATGLPTYIWRPEDLPEVQAVADAFDEPVD